jgi:hypothetical protein
MPTLQGTSPDGKHPREITIEPDRDPSFVSIWIHPPNASPGSGWEIRVRKDQLRDFLKQISSLLQ